MPTLPELPTQAQVDAIAAEAKEMFKTLNPSDWAQKIRTRMADTRKDEVLESAKKAYVRKIYLLRKVLLEGVPVKVENPDGTLRDAAAVAADRAEMEADIQAKIDRMMDKFAACDKELTDRADGKVVRENLV